MKIMKFDTQQPEVNIYNVGESGRDVVICENERIVTVNAGEEGNKATMYEYDGNIFRTYKLSEDEIRNNPLGYVDYPGDEAPSPEMKQYANDMIDVYTMQLLQEGVLS